MAKVVFDYETGKLISGKIQLPPMEWLAETLFIPLIEGAEKSIFEEQANKDVQNY